MGNFFTQTVTVHAWVICLMCFVLLLSIVQNVMRIIEEHHKKKIMERNDF